MSKPITNKDLREKAAIAALRLAIETINGLVDQQAMPDDSYLGPLETIERVLEELESK